MCGGTARDYPTDDLNQGLSPRVRGNPEPLAPGLPEHRSIPACAGEPEEGVAFSLIQWVYPRVCGGTGDVMCNLHKRPGLSPRVRGNPTGMNLHATFDGSIPACAGEPRFELKQWKRLRVYPRVCGGTL